MTEIMTGSEGKQKQDVTALRWLPDQRWFGILELDKSAQMHMVIKGWGLCESFHQVEWRPWWLCKHMRVRSWHEYLHADLREQEGTDF